MIAGLKALVTVFEHEDQDRRLAELEELVAKLPQSPQTTSTPAAGARRGP